MPTSAGAFGAGPGGVRVFIASVPGRDLAYGAARYKGRLLFLADFPAGASTVMLTPLLRILYRQRRLSTPIGQDNLPATFAASLSPETVGH